MAGSGTATREQGSAPAVTAGTPSLQSRWQDVVEAVLSHGKTTAPLLSAILEDHPDCVRALALKGLATLVLARREGLPVARQALADAEKAFASHGGWTGDALYLNALRLWLAGEPLAAAACFDDVLRMDPIDALAVKLAQSIRFMFGDKAGMLAGLAPFVGAFDEAAPLTGYVLGCHAFALEEHGRYAEAERLGRRAVELAPRDAWGRHAVAHVYEMTGRAGAGRAWLRSSAAWEHCNNFGFHMWWHLALFELEQGRFAEVLALYDERIRRQATDDFRDVANAVELLARLEIEGVDVGARWEELAEIAARRVGEHCSIFADLHYLCALAAAGRKDKASALVQCLAAHGEAGSGDTGRIARHAGVAVSDAIVAFQEARYGDVVDRLAPLSAGFSCLGGSDAQRDVFVQMFIESALRSGRTALAERLLRERLARRGGHNRFAERRLAAVAPSGKGRLGMLAATLLRPATAH